MEKFSKPNDLIEAMDIYGPMKIADFGAGAGFFTLPIAEKISEEGRVYALDIQEGPLESLRREAQNRNLHTIETIRANLEQKNGSHLKDSSLDRVFAANILFQTQDKLALFAEAYRILKKGGTLTIVEWDPDALPRMGPRHEHRLSKTSLRELVARAGFEVVREISLSDHFHGIIAKK